MALIRRINPLGQEEVVEVPEMLAPRGTPEGQPGDRQTDLPPIRPVESLRSQQPVQTPERPAGPGFWERLGGPTPDPQRGFWDSVGHFATSDLGRNLIGALGVGLAGIRNPRDQGRFQEQLMQTVLTGAKERQLARTQADAMGALMLSANEANALIAKGDFDGASRAIGTMASNPAVRRDPRAVQYVLKAQQDLAQRAATRQGIQALRESTKVTVPGTPAVRGEDVGGIGPFEVTPATPETTTHRPITTEDLLALAYSQGNLDVVKDLAPIFPKPTPHFFHNEKQGIVGLIDPSGQVLTRQYTPGPPKEPLTIENMKPYIPLLARLGVSDFPGFVGIYNNGDPKDPKAQGRAQALYNIAILQTQEESPLKSEQERFAEDLRKEEELIKAGKPVPANVKAGAERARIYYREQGKLAGTKAGATQDVALSGPIAHEAENYMDPETGRHPNASLSKQEVYKTYIPVKGEGAKTVMLRARPLWEALNRIEQIITTSPDLYPPSTGSKLKDNLAVGKAYANYFTGAKTDPRVGKLRDAFAPYGPALNRFSGDTGNVALSERATNLQALATSPRTREVALETLSELRSSIRDQMAQMGFNVDKILGGWKPSSIPGVRRSVQEN